MLEMKCVIDGEDIAHRNIFCNLQFCALNIRASCIVLTWIFSSLLAVQVHAWKIFQNGSCTLETMDVADAAHPLV